jgi:ribosome-associated toxin RatA of RatAB toxin-antitoxin module
MFGELIANGCEIDLTIHFDLDASVLANSCDGSDQDTRSKVFDMELYPEFLSVLSAIPAALRLQIWNRR